MNQLITDSNLKTFEYWKLVCLIFTVKKRSVSFGGVHTLEFEVPGMLRHVKTPKIIPLEY